MLNHNWQRQCTGTVKLNVSKRLQKKKQTNKQLQQQQHKKHDHSAALRMQSHYVFFWVKNPSWQKVIEIKKSHMNEARIEQFKYCIYQISDSR